MELLAFEGSKGMTLSLHMGTNHLGLMSILMIKCYLYYNTTIVEVCNKL